MPRVGRGRSRPLRRVSAAAEGVSDLQKRKVLERGWSGRSWSITQPRGVSDTKVIRDTPFTMPQW